MGDFKVGSRGGSRTRTLIRAGDFKSPVSTIPPLGHVLNISSVIDRVNRFLLKYYFITDNQSTGYQPSSSEI